jgi:DNA-binding NtrC family response regulator
VPSLRERPEDIPILAQHFLALLSGAGASGAPARLSRDTLENLRHHSFPGNVRELRNLIERSVVLAEAGLSPEAMAMTAPPPVPYRSPGAAAEAPGDPDPARGRLEIEVDETVPYRIAKQRLVGEFDARYLKKLLVRHGGNVSRAARAAGLDRMTVHKMLQRVGLGGWRGRPVDED